jgi:hypothetical protein
MRPNHPFIKNFFVKKSKKFQKIQSLYPCAGNVGLAEGILLRSLNQPRNFNFFGQNLRSIEIRSRLKQRYFIYANCLKK